jgi:hypothetical protein
VTPTNYQYEFKGFGDAEPINGGQLDKILCSRAEKYQLAPEIRNLLGQVALYGRGLLAEKAFGLLEAAAALRDILGDMLWQLGYIQDANGWSINIQSRAQADNIAQEILRQNPQGRLCSFVAAIKARRAVRVPGQSSDVTQAVMALSAYNAQEAWAANAVRARERGEPMPSPPVPPGPKGLDFGNGLASKHLEGLTDLIVSAPEAEQATLQLHTVELLAGWLLRKGQAVGPDGRIIVGVRTPEEASKIVAGWMMTSLPGRKAWSRVKPKHMSPCKSQMKARDPRVSLTLKKSLRMQAPDPRTSLTSKRHHNSWSSQKKTSWNQRSATSSIAPATHG